jgi:PIN domain nuclease of toxin-antitoxin system
MNYILDTHCFLWSAFRPEKLSRRVESIILDIDNEIFVSAVSFWEISLKYAIGKLELEGVEPPDLVEVAEKMGFEVMGLDAVDAASFCRLPLQEHRDPFDRILIWQAINSGKTLVSKEKFLEYKQSGLMVVW